MWESLTYTTVCQDCGARLECHGVQALVGDSLRWDVEAACSACGFAIAECDAALPAELRERMLSEHGAATLRVVPRGRNVPAMRVLRAALGLDPAGAKAALSRVLAGELSGTLPEMEFLADRMRKAGVPASATRP
ncbi:hypothetical protein JNUCC64_03870 [Streptomyces sp. JNUCC 64]